MAGDIIDGATAMASPSLTWTLPFLDSRDQSQPDEGPRKYALIILNTDFSLPLLNRVWKAAHWRSCADGGANRLHDLFHDPTQRGSYLPDLVKGDLDSLRDDVKEYYTTHGVNVVRDGDQYSTDLGKCIKSLIDKEKAEGIQYDILILGGLTGRLDQTVHTLSAVHKLRKTRNRVFVIADENVAWVLDEGEHHIHIDHKAFGQTCGLLPLGIDQTILTTRGLEWNLTDTESHFDGMVSTSNHLDPAEPVVYVKTTKPIWWTMEIRRSSLT